MIQNKFKKNVLKKINNTIKSIDKDIKLLIKEKRFTEACAFSGIRLGMSQARDIVSETK